MNITEVMGHLAADPETRFTSNGQKVIALRLASNSKAGGKDETMWWNISIWEDRCKIDKMLPYLKKGSALIIVGEMKTRLYTDKEGRPQISHDLTADMVRFSPFGKPDSMKQEGGQSQQGAYPSSNSAPNQAPYNGAPQTNYTGSSYGQNQSASMNNLSDDDNIPF